MLKEFLFFHDIDIAMLQEVTHPSLVDIPQYTSSLNIGVNKCGTAILLKEGLNVDDERKLPTGHGTAILTKGTSYVNVYAPSGAENRAHREEFFNVELPTILPVTPGPLVLAGDFNCILETSDTTGAVPRSPALARLQHGIGLHDVWRDHGRTPGYTHYAPHSASRIDRIYVTPPLHNQIIGTELLAAAFTDHMAVVLWLSAPTFQEQGRGYWKLNLSLLRDATFQEDLKTQWKTWSTCVRHYPNLLWWWIRSVKPKLKRLFMVEGAARKKDMTILESFYYRAIYDAIRSIEDPRALHDAIRELKCRVLHLRSLMAPPFQRVTEGELFDEERQSLFHLIRGWRRRTQHHVTRIMGEDGITYTTTRDILQVFTAFLRTKLTVKDTDRQEMDILLGSMPASVVVDEQVFKAPVTEEELWHALKAGKKNKAPGEDGVPTDFYQVMWTSVKQYLLRVVNAMHDCTSLPASMTKGIVVGIPKNPNPASPEEYRLLTLLNSDVRIFARIVANRIQPFLREILHPSQFGGGKENTILDALTTLRDTVALAELRHEPACMVSLFFRNAFDNIAHDYLYTRSVNYIRVLPRLFI
jgi:hypothetical protein